MPNFTLQSGGVDAESLANVRGSCLNVRLSGSPMAMKRQITLKDGKKASNRLVRINETTA